MSLPSRFLVLVVGIAAATPCLAADPAPIEIPRSQTIGLRVTVDAAGKVQTAKPVDPKIGPGLNNAAEAFARKLTFSPARKNGVAVPAETTMTLVLSLEPRPDGQYGLHLKRAVNGPGVLEIGKMEAPKYQQGPDYGALVVVGVSLLADGRADMKTLTTERMELRAPSAFAGARYLDVIRVSLRGSRFELDKVDGIAIPEHISAPYLFGGGPTKPKPGDDERDADRRLAEEMELPSLNAVSLVPGIELAKIDYREPAPTTPPVK